MDVAKEKGQNGVARIRGANKVWSQEDRELARDRVLHSPVMTSVSPVC